MTTVNPGPVGPTPLNEPVSFVDSRGREWDLTLNALIARRIDNSDFSVTTKLLGDFSILDPSETLFSEILNNRSFALAVCWVVVLPQVIAWVAGKQMSEEEIDGLPKNEYEELYSKAEKSFLASMSGPAMYLMQRRLAKALGNFIPEWETVLSTLIEERERGVEKAIKVIQENRDKIRDKADREIDAELLTLLGN